MSKDHHNPKPSRSDSATLRRLQYEQFGVKRKEKDSVEAIFPHSGLIRGVVAKLVQTPDHHTSIRVEATHPRDAPRAFYV